MFDTLGREWETPRIGFKPYPCCHYNHAYIDCALRLRREQRIEADAIASIECRVPAGESSEAFAERLLGHGVVVAPGSFFGPSGEGYVRLALVPSLEECERAAAILAEAL